MKITYAITVCDEIEELQRLVEILERHMQSQDEIVIQYDEPNAPVAIANYLCELRSAQKCAAAEPFALNNDFATFKNNLKNFSNGDYVFQIDADEYPSENLLLNIHNILNTSPDVDVLEVARVNTVKGLSPAQIKKWGWRVNADGWVNFPDPQRRIYRNSDAIAWTNRVHETLTGYGVCTHLPWVSEFALFHPKTVERQEKQNSFYEWLTESNSSLPLPTS